MLFLFRVSFFNLYNTVDLKEPWAGIIINTTIGSSGGCYEQLRR